MATQQLANLVEKAARDDKLVVTLGGDHTLATGSLIGHLRARPNLCVLYIDAMNDNNSHRTSPTGWTFVSSSKVRLFGGENKSLSQRINL